MSTNCPDRPDSARFIAGCMTGTSLDGLDVALAEVRGRGVDLEAKLLGTIGRPLDDVRGPLLDLARGAAAPPINYLRAGRRLGELHADAIAALCARDLAHGATLDFVTAHGQTIWHAPDERLSWQLLDPWPIVRRLGVPVCHDLRQADLIAGGQGAPITPVADAILYRDAGTATIVNLGGICNVTELDPAAPRGVRGGRSFAKRAKEWRKSRRFSSSSSAPSGVRRTTRTARTPASPR